MNKFILVLVAAIALSGCQAVDKITTSASDLLASFQPLKVDDFCALKSSDLETAKRRYSGKGYTFTGTIETMASSNSGYTVGIKDDGGIIWAQFQEFDTTFRKGDYASIQGIISPANFNDDNRRKCLVLLDDAKIKE